MIKKMLAPIIITIIMIAYYAVYFAFLIAAIDEFWAWFLGLIPVIIGILMIAVCLQRIKEIRSGEEDDLSKY